VDISKINYNSFLGKFLRAPLKLIPSNTVLPIMQGVLKGKKWIKGSSINGCWLGSYEYNKQLLFKEYLNEGMIVYDIGANAGFYTLLSSFLVGNKGKVFSFEPFPLNIEFLQKHIELNLLHNVAIVPKAVSKENSMSLFKVGKNSSVGKIAEDGELKIKTVSLDKFIESDNPPPNFIKMDIEGAEYDALIGAKDTLKKYRPVIFLATHGKDIHKKCINLLISFGYQLKYIGSKNYEETDEIIATFFK